QQNSLFGRGGRSWLIGVVPAPIRVIDLAACATRLFAGLIRDLGGGRSLRRSTSGCCVPHGRGVTVTVMVASGVPVVISVAIMMCNMMVTVRMATQLLYLAGRHIAITPTCFFPLVPSRGTLVVTVMI